MATLWKQPVPVQSVDDLPKGPQVTPGEPEPALTHWPSWGPVG